MQIPEGLSRNSYYSVPYYPIAYKDGNLNGLNTIEPSYPGWLPNWTQTVINNEYAISSPFTMSLNWHFTPANDSVVVNCIVTATEPVTMTTPKLQLALIERTIHFSTPPGSNGETDFWNICRKMYPDANGTAIPTSWTTNQEQTFTFKQIIPANVYQKTQIAFVAFIQDDATKSVKQNSYTGPQVLNTIQNPTLTDNLNILVYPNPINSKGVVSFYLENPDYVSIQLIDMLGNIVYMDKSKRQQGSQIIPIDCMNLSNGIYYLKVETKEKNCTKKLIVNK